LGGGRVEVRASEVMGVFREPPVEYRPAPLFVFNDEHEGVAGEDRISRMFESYRRIGFGGGFLHPRPGLMTEYLSPRWFELARHFVRECGRLGLVPYLYDENSYPSGVGGGHVPARVPEAVTRYVIPAFGEGPEDAPANPLSLHLWEEGRPGAPVGGDDVRPGQRWVAFVMRRMEPVAWHGETACPSLLDPRTAETFIETTYEAYRRELGELWNEVPAVFTDEPHLPAESHGPWGAGLHLTPYLLGQFRQHRGYDLRPNLASVFYDVGDYRRVRFDLYDLMHELWVENWALPMERWCEEHGVSLTGHYLEHDWPSPYATPGQAHMLAHMQWPGTDMLETFLLKGHDFHDIQNFYPTGDGREPHALMYLRQVHSVANQLGKERVLDESWGAGGHDSTPADWARIGRWLVVHGVNLLVPHLSFTTIRGTRKSDHPQTFSDHSPWFEHLRPLSDELSRLCWASNQGRIEQRVLVLDPLTTGFCASRKADCLPRPEFGEDGGEVTHSAGAPPGEELYRKALASVVGLQEDFDELAQSLSDAQAGFDLGDEYVIEEFGRVDGAKISVGEQQYGLVVWPGCLTNLRARTAAMLEEFLVGGGTIYGVRPEEITVNGRPSDLLQRYEREFEGEVRWFPDRDSLVRAILERVPPRLRLDDPPATGLAHMRRVLDGSELFIVVNSSSQEISSPLSLETDRKALYELDPVSGDCYPLETSREEDWLRAHLELNPRAATVLWAADEEVPASRRPPTIRLGETPVPLELKTVERVEPNVLVLDTCRLRMGEEIHEPETVYAANERLWKAHGMDTNGWMATVQYRDQILARNSTMTPDSGGTVCYRFEVSGDSEPANVRLAVETPELWRVKVNGSDVDFSGGERWLDDHIRAVPVGGCLGAGENIVELEGCPFDVRREVDQVYLLGDFACSEDDPGFSIHRPRPLKLGSWRSQGLPFYDREVSYTFELPETAGEGALLLEDDDWRGAVLLVEQEGRFIALLREPPYRVRLDGNRGRDVTLRVVGLPKNLLGPWHDPARQRGRAWIPMWYGPGVSNSPRPGREYDLLDLGLFRAPRWSGSPG
jgi:hypothetical protein